MSQCPILPVLEIPDGITREQMPDLLRHWYLGSKARNHMMMRRFGEVDSELPAAGDNEPVRHFGKNTLPLFTHFEKRFCRLPDSDSEKPEQLAGFNFQTMAAVTGPGYYVAVDDEGRTHTFVTPAA